MAEKVVRKANGRKVTKRKPKSERQKLIKQLDTLSKQLVRIRDGGICQKTGEYVTGSNCHVSHVIPVSAGMALRWDLLNMKVLSYHQHLNWWHKNPIESGEWFKAKFPDRYEYLQKNKGTRKFSVEELRQLKESYEKMLVNVDQP